MSLATADLPPHVRARITAGSSGIRPMTDAARPWRVDPVAGITDQETSMARYIDIHSGFVGATEEQLRAAHQSRRRVEDTEGVRFERTWLDPEYGKVFCLSTAPSKEALLRVHERAGHPAAEVYEVPIEVC